jgi:hypothetical protein
LVLKMTILPPWLKTLRDSEIVGRVKNDPRTAAGKLLGVEPDRVKNEVICWGQADFDAPWEHLSADERALLYAYFNQLGHIEELTEAFRMLFAATRPTDPPIVVDLGCGPFTGGLAMAGVLGPELPFTYIGVDRAAAMHRLGEALAVAAERLDGMRDVQRLWSKDLASLRWVSPPSWPPVFVIVSYLLASPTLDATALITELEGLLAQLGRGPVTVLYTNSTTSQANRSFPTFRAALENAGFELAANDAGLIKSPSTNSLPARLNNVR